MAVKIDGKVYRNLQEQVLANTRNIESLTGTPTLTRHYVQLQDVANNKVISATFIFIKSAKITSMDDLFNTLRDEYGFTPSYLPFFGENVIYNLTFLSPTIIAVYAFNMATASVIHNSNIIFLQDKISTMGDK